MAQVTESFLSQGHELRETHISRVWLGEHEVWKIKKPVALGFLDFRTLQARKAACEAEVVLNRRLAPDVYLGVVPVTNAAGELVDYAVHMRRLRDEDSASARLARGELGEDDVRAIAERLCAFHAVCACDAHTGSFGTPEVIARNVQENFSQVAERIDEYVSGEAEREIERFQLGFVSAHAALFAARIAAGRVRDGHGDLRLEHVYFAEGGAPCVIDCIEFNERFRFADVCADVAFLAMDLAWNERAELAEQLVAHYAQRAGDYDLYALFDFYASYRAYVRGKVESFVADDASQSAAARERARVQARKHFVLAQAYARPLERSPRIVAVGGVIGTGKSGVAAHAGSRLAAPVVDADRTRKQLFAVHETTRLDGAGEFRGAYSADASARVYTEVLRRAEVVVRSGRSVIVDASFRSRDHRAQIVALARALDVPLWFLECRAPEAVCRERLRARDAKAVVSDGREGLYDSFVASFEPITELGSLPNVTHVAIDTDGPRTATRAKIDASGALA